jgi:hypothetical protein
MIRVDLGGDDIAALDTMAASRQGLVLVLLDGRVLLLPLSLQDAQTTEAAWRGGSITDLRLRGDYVQFHRMRLN